MRFSFNKVSTVSLPKPSISRPDLDPKNIKASLLAILHFSLPAHRGTFSSLTNSIEYSSHKHFFCKDQIFEELSLLSGIEDTTSGITSPARLTIT